MLAVAGYCLVLLRKADVLWKVARGQESASMVQTARVAQMAPLAQFVEVRQELEAVHSA